MNGNEDPARDAAGLVATKDPQNIRGMFREISQSYDFLNHLLSLNIDKVWRARAARKLVQPGTRRVLDVCCGTGDLALALHRQAKKLGADPVIVATDFTPEMCLLAQRKFSNKQGSAVATCAVADTLALPFQDDTFDLVTVAFGIRNVADTRAGLQEMCRVCRPGGTVAVIEFSHPNQKVFRQLYFWYFFKVLPRIGALISRTSAYRYLSKSVADFPDTEQFCKLFSETIQGPIEAHRFTFGIATLYIGKRPATA